MTDLLEWYYPHDSALPSDNRAVAVLIPMRDGTFKPDIGRYYGVGPSKGWSCQFWGSDSPVIAWTNLPDFKDDVQIIEHETDGVVSSPPTEKENG